MKTTVPKRFPLWGTAAPLAALISICLITGDIQAAPSGVLNAFSTLIPNDTILVQKQQTSKKHRIRLYPNANHQVLFFSASGEEGKVFQLFVFDMEGKLIKQVNIRNRQTTVLNSIDKGNYIFEVFSDDERIENGQLIVK